MTIKEIEQSIEESNLTEAEVEKLNLLIAASKSFAKEMYDHLQGLALNKKLRDFLESEQFAGTIYSVILKTRKSKVDAQQKLRTKEIKLLKNRKATIEEQLIICEKLRAGIRDLLRNSKELDYDTLLFQGLFVYYIDSLNHKLSANN